MNLGLFDNWEIFIATVSANGAHFIFDSKGVLGFGATGAKTRETYIRTTEKSTGRCKCILLAIEMSGSIST